MRKIEIMSLILTSIFVFGCRDGVSKGAVSDRLQVNDTGTAVIAFTEYEYSFGKVEEGKKIKHLFTFENKGSADLIIESATTSCGCTVPKYDTKPIAPGKRGNLEVVFDTSGRNGMQTKTITVKSNALVPVLLLKITAEVVPDNN